MIRRFLFVFALAALMLPAALSFAGQKGNNYVTEDGVAVKGYDVVSYIEENKAQEGSSDFAVEHEGVTYYFVSADNKAAFEKEPGKYLPQYGGWCAYGVGAANQKFPVNPETFKVTDGKLYLFFNDEMDGKPLNTLVPWNADEANLIIQADQNWSVMSSGR